MNLELFHKINMENKSIRVIKQKDPFACIYIFIIKYNIINCFPCIKIPIHYFKLIVI